MAGGKGKKDEKEQVQPIIVKRIKKVAGGHHGGAWKVAYADFVTAMMAFFLLLWLLNVTTEDQKNAISNFFDPSHPQISDSLSGAGGILGGLTMSPEGAMVSTVQPISQPEVPDTTSHGAQMGSTEGEDLDPENIRDLQTEQLEKVLKKKEDERFKKAAKDLKEQIEQSPDLKDLQKNTIVDITPEGLRIQIVDDQGRSMFPSGSAQMYDFMKKLLLKVAQVMAPLPNHVSIRGHTDANKYKNPARYDNWNLSADRAQASRRVLSEGGLPDARIENVMGRADREHLVPADPANARNRRITVVLLRDNYAKAAAEKKAKAAKEAAKPKTGSIQIVDDTKTDAAKTDGTQNPQGTTNNTEGTSQSGARNARMHAEITDSSQPLTPLPTTPVRQKFKTQPQVMYFGDNGGDEAKPDAPLYKGPVQSPFTNKPPQITKKLFDLPSDHVKPKAGALDAAPAQKQEAPKDDRKTIIFEDVPAVSNPTKPAAPAALPPAEGTKLENPDEPSTVLQFGN